MPGEESVAIEEFYPTRKSGYSGFCVPGGREEWRDKSVYGMLEKLWKMPEECWVERVPTAIVRDAILVEERTLEERFLEQAEKWEQDTKFVSSVTKRVSHPSYTAILGMGQEPGIIEILLRDLEANRRPWFWALSYITQSNPIPPGDVGKMDKMIAAWVNWGKQKGYLR